MGRLAVLAERYVRGRVRSIANDGGPGPVLRLAAGRPIVASVVIAAALIALFASIFGVPPVSPLFLVLVLCSPLPFWFRLEARAQERWRRDGTDGEADAG
ncbi:MAG: hypothetical protein WD638_10095 [Nitriliruptoraceae bacterium]